VRGKTFEQEKVDSKEIPFGDSNPAFDTGFGSSAAFGDGFGSTGGFNNDFAFGSTSSPPTN
jgi:hypothetical protein